MKARDRYMGAYYNYDASGERNLKLTGGTVDVTQNGYTMNVPVLDQQTLYASALVTINDKGYTKHYFEEGKRICSKIGSGGLQDINTLVDQMELNYEEQFEKQKDGVTKTYEECMNITPHIKNENLYENIIKKYGQQQPVNPDEPVFFYHSDHLGSASYITDNHGYETQHLVYLPFGEDWVDIKYGSPAYETPYKFNGKEKDPETGYNYYGARYLNTDLSIWLSVDPMSDKYPHLTSYNYCANNPVMLIDPDGEAPRIYIEKNGVGHAFITAGTGKNTVVYSYGRYLGGNKGKSSSNSTDPSGRGVLIKLTGKEAQRYINNQLKNKGANAYEITDASDNKVIKHFDKIFLSGKNLTKDEASKYNTNSNKYGSSEDARVIDNYNLLNNNCASKTIEGAKAGGTKESFLEETSSSYNPYTPGSMKVQPISPVGLDSHLKLKSQSKNSNVKNVTKSVNIEYN